MAMAQQPQLDWSISLTIARITRQTQKIFGETSGFQQMIQVGSLNAGATLYVTPVPASIPTIQALSNYLAGWYNIAIGNNSPTIEDMNALFFLLSYQAAYMLQSGISEYDAGTTYYTGNTCAVPVVIFTVTSAAATVGATYTNNGATFTVLQTIAAGTRLVCYGNAGVAPAASGTLTKSGGTGDSTITFSDKAYQTSIYVSVADAQVGQAITNTTYWAAFAPAVGKPYQRLQSNAAGTAQEYSWDAINPQTSEASLTVPAGYNLNNGFLTIPTGQTYLVVGSMACAQYLTAVGTITVTGTVLVYS